MHTLHHMTGPPAGIVHMYGVRFVDGQGAALEVDPRTRPCDQNIPRPDQGKKKKKTKKNYRRCPDFRDMLAYLGFTCLCWKCPRQRICPTDI